MKWLVNKVNPESYFAVSRGDKVQPETVSMSKYYKGYVFGLIENSIASEWFTIAEIDDEGYIT